jgi:hypothetical protein
MILRENIEFQERENTWEWGQLHNEGVYYAFSSPNCVTLIHLTRK